MIEDVERTVRKWTGNLGMTLSTAKKNEGELHAMILQWLADQRGDKSKLYFAPADLSVYSHFTEEARKSCLSSLGVPEKYLGTNTGRADGPNPNLANIPKKNSRTSIAKILAYENNLQKLMARVRYSKEDKMTTKSDVRVFVEGVEVTEFLVGDAEWLSTSPTRKFSLKKDAFVLTPSNVCRDPAAVCVWPKEEQAKSALFLGKLKNRASEVPLGPNCPVIASGDSLTVYRFSEPKEAHYLPVFSGRISGVTVVGDELQVEGRSFAADLKLLAPALDTKQDLAYLRTAKCHALGFDPSNPHDYSIGCSVLPQPTLAIGHEGKLLLTFPGEGDDLMVLHMPDPVSGENKPVLRLKRNSELDIDPCWRRHTGELALQFWRGVADVCRTLPPPVSPKQEAIIAFCTEKKMPLKEFDANYYAEPVNHGEVVDADVRVYPGTGQEPYAWGIYPIEPWPEKK
jgi:hypothetical protein